MAGRIFLLVFLVTGCGAKESTTAVDAYGKKENNFFGLEELPNKKFRFVYCKKNLENLSAEDLKDESVCKSAFLDNEQNDLILENFPKRRFILRLESATKLALSLVFLGIPSWGKGEIFLYNFWDEILTPLNGKDYKNRKMPLKHVIRALGKELGDDIEMNEDVVNWVQER